MSCLGWHNSRSGKEEQFLESRSNGLLKTPFFRLAKEVWICEPLVAHLIESLFRNNIPPDVNTGVNSQIAVLLWADRSLSSVHEFCGLLSNDGPIAFPNLQERLSSGLTAVSVS